MIINGVEISTRRMQELSAVLNIDALSGEYLDRGLTDREISEKYAMSKSWVCKLRTIYGIPTRNRYGLYRNPLRHQAINSRQIEFLYGTLLGDSCIAVQKSGTGFWQCTHSLKQEQYLLKQVAIMQPFVSKVSYGNRPFVKDGKSFPFVRARTYALPFFTDIREELYHSGIKTVTESWFRKLTPLGFAYWFMDDGSTTGYGFDITTYEDYFRKDEAKNLFKEVLGLSVSVRWVGREGRIHVLKESYDRAWEYIQGELTTDMYHKIPKRYKCTTQR